MDFAAFYAKYHQLVENAAYSVTHSREDAEDIAQTVFMNVIRRPDRLELAQNVKGYLHQAAVKEALKFVRSRLRQRVVADLDSVVEQAGPSPSVLEQRGIDAMRHAINQLKPEEIELLVLRYGGDYTNDEIAEIRGCTSGTVAIKLWRIRAQVRSLMNPSAGLSIGVLRRAVGFWGRLSMDEGIR